MKNKGVLYGLIAYTSWGLLPIYWKALKSVPPGEILSHRMVWSFLLLLGVLTVSHRWGWVRPVLRQPKVLFTFLLTASLLSVNWLTYIWAVNAGFIVESALGYFINPLVNVLLGMVFLRERLRPWQAVAVLIAAAGVLYLTITYGALPWIALTLAFSFGFYGLLRKTAVLNSLEGLSLETGWMFVPAFTYLILQQVNGTGAVGNSTPLVHLLLIGTGVITALPLLLFAAAARRVTLITLGILQYIAPTLQFLIGVFVYDEPFTHVELIGFSLIWLALLIYTADAFVRQRRRKQPAPAQPVPGDAA
ncbi:MAG: EamA family transporter RarD [Ardenticatenaceae bacterium]|nr:EamA family transporter RarD [Ardenticatenaceae bacterium]